MPTAPKPTPRVALCVIFRDNEKTIDALLESVCRSKRPNGDLVGYAFDEYVFVDTGCTDETKSRIAAAFGLGAQDFPTADRESKKLVVPRVEGAVADPRWSGDVTVTFARFDWINDFSAARNFSFELAESPWRMYLDTDDVFPLAAAVRPTLAKSLADAPEVDTCILPYHYDPTVTQKIRRIVRWDAGFAWHGMIHENLKKSAGDYKVALLDVLPVLHTHDPSRLRMQLDRNVMIARKEFEELSKLEHRTHDDDMRLGKAAHTIGAYSCARVITDGEFDPPAPGDFSVAESMFLRSAELMPWTNLGARARMDLGRLYAHAGRNDDAIREFTIAAEHDPIAPEPLAYLAVLYWQLGMRQQFAATLARLEPRMDSKVPNLRDVYLVDGQVPTAAAEFFFENGDVDRASAWMRRVDAEAIRGDAVLHARMIAVTTKINKGAMLAKFIDYVRALIASDNVKIAREVMSHPPPYVVEMPGFHDFKAYFDHWSRVLNGWSAYKAAYDSIPPEEFDPKKLEGVKDQVLGLHRARALIAWARDLGTSGPPARVLCIGSASTTMEGELLRTNPRVHLTIAEASEFGGPAIEALEREFPGRVSRHVMRDDEIDWPYGSFDLVYMFEVIEHLAQDIRDAVPHLIRRVAPGGKLMISTPYGPAWFTYAHVEQGKKHAIDFWGHMRGHVDTTFFNELTAGTDATSWQIERGDSGSSFLATYTRPQIEKERHGLPVRFFVPGAFPEFDAETHESRHLGGSEEAVIHLARAIAKTRPVEVFVKRPAFGSHKGAGGLSYLIAKDGVLYRDIDEFSFFDRTYGSTIFWRCPQIAEHPDFAKAYGKKVLWLHDTHYGAKPATYAKFDAVLTLTDYHREVLIEAEGGDGWDTVKFVPFRNGVDVGTFPTGLPRDPKKAIYCSSPDRGLDVLLELWPRVKELVPDATLDIYYSWDLLKQREPALFAHYTKLVESVKHLGVRYLGGVDHRTLHEAMARAGVFAYPCTFREIFAIAAAKAQVAGMRCATTEYAALAETALDKRYTVFEVFTDAGKIAYLEQLVHALTDPWDHVGIEQPKIAAEAFDWSTTPKLLDGVLWWASPTRSARR